MSGELELSDKFYNGYNNFKTKFAEHLLSNEKVADYDSFRYFSNNEVFGKYNSLNHHIEVNVPSLDTSISHFKSILKNINRVDKELSKMNNVSLK